MGGVGSWIGLVAWVRGHVGKSLTWVAWVRKILALVNKKSVGSVVRNFGVGGVVLSRLFKKVLLKVSQNLQENTCASVSC